MPITLRPATPADVPLLEQWDEQPHVISATTDDPEAEAGFDADWDDEIAMQSDVYRYYIAERGSEPVGAMQIIDPHREPTGYWQPIEPGLRAVDIWIGPASLLGQGLGTAMMRAALDLCFADREVEAVVIDPLASNTRAHRFYQRLGFKPEGRRTFNGEDDCLVHRLTRTDWNKEPHP